MSIIRCLSIAVLVSAAFGARAESTVDTAAQLEVSEGDYGGSETSTQWLLALSGGVRTDRWLFDVVIPLISAEGTVNRETGGLGSRFGQSSGQGVGNPGAARTTSESQTGLGDVVVGAAFTVLRELDTNVGLDIGARAKLVTANRSDDLLTTGHEDYSVHLTGYGTAGRARLSGSVAYTWKGDVDVRDDEETIARVDADDPLSALLSAAYPVNAATRLGVSYYWRERLFDGSDAASESTLFVVRQAARNWQFRGSATVGFSDSSPEWAAGMSVSRGW